MVPVSLRAGIDTSMDENWCFLLPVYGIDPAVQLGTAGFDHGDPASMGTMLVYIPLFVLLLVKMSVALVVSLKLQGCYYNWLSTAFSCLRCHPDTGPLPLSSPFRSLIEWFLWLFGAVYGFFLLHCRPSCMHKPHHVLEWVVSFLT